MDKSTDKEKFIRILKEHKRIIIKVIYSYCKDSEDRKDLEQEIVFQIWRSLKSYDERCKVSTWIYRVALNVAITHYRKESARNEKNTTLEESIFQIAEDDSSEEERNKQELLYQLINRFDPLNKAIIILYLEDKSYRDISELLGISETNVGTKLNRMKNQLKEYFSQLNN